MKFPIKCVTCGAIIWISGAEEPDVNAVVLNDNDPDWADACEHMAAGGDYEIGAGEVEDDYL